MNTLKLTLVLLASALLANTAWSLPRMDEGSVSANAQKPVLLAEAKTSRSGKGVREKHIVREGRTKKGDQRNIDFDAVDISGERKTPLGTMVNNNKLDKNYDFVKIRLRWHPEMVQSASSLESGGSR